MQQVFPVAHRASSQLSFLADESFLYNNLICTCKFSKIPCHHDELLSTASITSDKVSESKECKVANTNEVTSTVRATVKAAFEDDLIMVKDTLY